MSSTHDFYQQRAKAAEAAAEDATLINVRDRELRSAKAWRGMADRQLMIDAGKVKADAERAARREEECAAFEAERVRRLRD